MATREPRSRQRAKLFRVEQGNPAHAESFRARSKPEVLDGAGHRSEIHVRHGAPTEDMPLTSIHQRRHQYFPVVQDALHLESHELVLAFAPGDRSALAFGTNQRVDLRSQATVSDAEEAPGLHEADTGGEMRSVQQAFQQRRIERVRPKVAHVATFPDDVIDGGNFPVGVARWVHGLNSGAVALGREGRSQCR